jgi:hypothetical protein
MQHENDHLATRRIKWLGLRTSEMSGYAFKLGRLPFARNADRHHSFGSLEIDYDSMLLISKHDEKKVF